MTLEEINEIDDKVLRLNLLNEYIVRALQSERDAVEIAGDDQRGATRDDAFGMMSRFGKPADD